MRSGWFVLLFALAFAARVQAQSLDGSVLDASVSSDAGPLDASRPADGGARDGGLDASAKLDLDLPEQGCRLAHGSDVGGALTLLLALALTRRQGRRS